MATDFSRIRHDPLLDWSGIQLKQGSVLLDADANELVAVLDRRLRALASDVLGRATVSQTTPDGFRITVAGGELLIDRGRLYVDGLLAENHGGGAIGFDALLAEPDKVEPLRYGTQPYLPSPPPLPTSGRHLVYLDVWQREVTALEHPDLVENAVGVDTASRLQTAWQVRVLPEDVGNASCGTPDGEVSGWPALIAPSEGRLSTGTHDVPPLDDPCELPPTGGYRGLENQLYRVEIHDPGTPGGGATFKWSRENASVGARVATFVSASELELETLGRDDVLGFNDGDWIEILDDAREFSGEPGEIRRIDIPEPGNRRIVLSAALPAAMLPSAFPDSSLPDQNNLRVRRWDQRGKVFRANANGSTTQVHDLDAATATGAIPVPAAGVALILENGVTVSFDSVGTLGFRSGDWWVFTGRTADAKVETLERAPPRGTHHHYARLGIWDIASGTVSDCRHPWPPAGGDDCACTQCVSPEQHNSGQLTIQTAVDRLRDRGGTVCLQPGNYVLAEPVRIAGSRAITVRGQGPTTVLAAPGTAFRIESSMAIAIERLTVLSLGRESAIEIRTVMGVTLRDLLVYVFQNNDWRGAAISLAGLCAAVSVRDNLVLAADGIRTESGRNEDGAGFALLAALTIERNLLSCQRRGIALEGTVAWLWDNRIAGNQLLTSRNGGVLVGGLAAPASSLHVSDNFLNVQGNGIACGIGGAWITHNKVRYQAQENRTGIFDGVALVAGLDPSGADQVHVLGNQIGGFSGAGLAIRAPVRDLVVKLNIITTCGNGIVMEEDAESASVSVENNHIRDIVGSAESSDAAIVAGISILRTASATIAGNQVHEVAVDQRLRTLSAGVMISGVERSRIHGNEISRIGPPVRISGRAVGILVRAPLEQTEIAQNSVRRDDEMSADESMWYALVVQDAARAPIRDLVNRVNSPITHVAGMSTVHLDDRRTLVMAAGRAYIATAALGFAATAEAAASAARGSVAMIHNNNLAARGETPAVDVRTTAEVMFSNNRCELLDTGTTVAVIIESLALVFSGNRVINPGEASVHLKARQATVLGNISRFPISLNGASLPAPWNALNVVG